MHPALSVAALLLAEHDTVLFVGTPDGLESRIVPAAGIPFVGVPASGFDRARPLTLLTSSVRILTSTFRAWRLLGRNRPDVVVGFGGYVSIPVGMAAVARGIPLVVHEQNSVPGMANRMLSRFAVSAGVTYPESAALLAHPERAVVTGNPVRQDVLTADRASARANQGFGDDELVLLVFGGSRGSRHVNEALAALAPRILSIERLQVVHVSGPAEVANTRDAVTAALSGAGHRGTPSESGDPDPRWRVVGYLQDMASALWAADVVVARAGATSIAELTAVGAPAVLVPYPYATDDHQTKNAVSMERAGAAIVIPDGEIDSDRFAGAVLGLLGDAPARATMAAASRAAGRVDAGARVVKLVRFAVRPDDSSDKD
ncbi:MAG: undecaprenyldiphospho-muramoylpentapeptide beta-N-acetylglucosaminyltransferase [Coriobacteriia bacterium]|nr:undecaprenyldiphospho-muramoylpentapeptide beta-N-acetylglucosaminyltransferase [Coriobacteriia bacterium]